MYQYKALITRVIDGDTVEARIDLGFEVFFVETIRLYGINAPEKRKATMQAAVKSEEALREMVEGKDVLLESKAWDKYGRCVAVLTLGEVNVNQKMIDDGFAVVYLV